MNKTKYGVQLLLLGKQQAATMLLFGRGGGGLP